jgi:hypothetical protein
MRKWLNLSIESVPIGVLDAMRLANLAGDQCQVFFWNSANVDFNVKEIVR